MPMSARALQQSVSRVVRWPSTVSAIAAVTKGAVPLMIATSATPVLRSAAR
jgi:hypothetical protein